MNTTINKSCSTCRHSDSWGHPDCVMPHSCGSERLHWQPLNAPSPQAIKEKLLGFQTRRAIKAEAERDALKQQLEQSTNMAAINAPKPVSTGTTDMNRIENWEEVTTDPVTHLRVTLEAKINKLQEAFNRVAAERDSLKTQIDQENSLAASAAMREDDLREALRVANEKMDSMQQNMENIYADNKALLAKLAAIEAQESYGVKGYAMALNEVALKLRKRYENDLLATPLWADFENARNKFARSIAAPAQPVTELYAKQCSLQAGESDGDVNYADGCHDCAKRIREMAAPAQPVNELVGALEGLMTQYKNQPVIYLDWSKDRKALSNAKAAQPLTKESEAEEVLTACATRLEAKAHELSNLAGTLDTLLDKALKLYASPNGASSSLTEAVSIVKKSSHAVTSSDPISGGTAFINLSRKPEPLTEDQILGLLEHPGCERIKDFYNVGPVQRSAVESLIDEVLKVSMK